MFPTEPVDDPQNREIPQSKRARKSQYNKNPADEQGAVAPLRLLFVIDGWFPAMGGAELQALKLAHELENKGASIDFVAPHLNKSMPVHDIVQGFRLTKITYPSIRLFGSLWLNLRFGWYLLRHRRHYDSVHIHITQNFAATAGFLRPFLKIPIVTKVSGFYEFEYGVLSPNKMKNPIMRIIRRGLRNVDFVQAISLETEQRLLEAGFTQRQIQTIPNGVQLNSKPRQRIWKSGDEFIVGYCGRLQPVKGVDILIHGFERFIKNNPDFPARLRIAGSGAVEKQLRELVSELNMNDYIEFIGVVEETNSFLANCDLYVQPSYAEGLPNSVIEALNAGLPVVATAVGGNKDLVEEGVTGLLFPAGDSDALAGCLQRCVNDPAMLREMGEQGRLTIAQRYGFDAITPQLMALYRHVQ